jgi:hypothetical protein
MLVTLTPKSISSTFYTRIFVQKQIEQLSIVTCQLLLFWRQNISAKFERKMLVKLTPFFLLDFLKYANPMKQAP